jgi:hypothetical protein
MAIVNVKTFEDYILQAEVLTGTYTWTGSTSYVLIGANDTSTGEFNSELISASQGSSGSANDVCRNHVSGGFNDWYLPSNDELLLCYENGIVSSTDYFWSSTEIDINKAYAISTTGVITDLFKGLVDYDVVAVRKQYLNDVITIERMNLTSINAPILNGGVNNADEDVYKMLGGINGISKNSKILINE